METMMSDVPDKKYRVDDVAYKNEDDPDVIASLLIMEPDQTDPLDDFVIFAWKTEHGNFSQKFGPFKSGLAKKLFAQEHWPKAYKAFREKCMAAPAAREIVLAPTLP